MESNSISTRSQLSYEKVHHKSGVNGYILNSSENMKSQLLKICESSSNEYIINSYRNNKNIILSQKFVKNNLYVFLSELCKKSKYEILQVLFKEIDMDIKQKKLAHSLKDLLSSCFALLNNAVWLSKTDIDIFEKDKKEGNIWFNEKVDNIIKTIIIIINEFNSQVIFNKVIKYDDENKNKCEKTIKESFLDALSDSVNGFNKDNDYTYSNIIYDKITRNFVEISSLINPIKFDNIIAEIYNKLSDNITTLRNTKYDNINFQEKRNDYYNDWYLFFITHFTNKFIDKLIKVIITNQDDKGTTSDKYINLLLLKPSYASEFKRYFKYFFDSDSKIYEYYTNIAKYIITDVYTNFIEALELYENELNECIKLEKEELSESEIIDKIDKFKKNNNNIFYDYFKYSNSDFGPLLMEEIYSMKLYSDKLKCISKFLIKKMSNQFYKILGFLYKNNFLKEDIIKIIMKNNFKYTNINFMTTFVKYSNIKWNDDCSYHKNMMILFKKKYESILLRSDNLTKFRYDELFKLYNNIIQLVDNNLSSPDFKIDCAKDRRLPLKINTYFIPISRKPSFDVIDHINDVRIGTETPIFNKELSLISPVQSLSAFSPSSDFNSYDNNELPDNYDLQIDHYLLDLMIKLDHDKILDYINEVIDINNELSIDIIIITLLHSLENKKIDNLTNIITLISKLDSKIKINKNIIDNIFVKYIGLKDDLEIDNPLLMNKLNIIFA